MSTQAELQAQVIKLTEQLCSANIQIAHLRSNLNHRDRLARTLIAANNRKERTISPRRAEMNATKQQALELGCVVKVGAKHV